MLNILTDSVTNISSHKKYVWIASGKKPAISITKNPNKPVLISILWFQVSLQHEEGILKSVEQFLSIGFDDVLQKIKDDEHTNSEKVC